MIFGGYHNHDPQTMEARIWPRNSVSRRADFYFKWEKQPRFDGPFYGTFTYRILATDMKEFAVAWRCYIDNYSTVNQHLESLWILTNSSTPSNATITKAIDAAVAAGLPVDRNRLITVKQENCDV